MTIASMGGERRVKMIVVLAAGAVATVGLGWAQGTAGAGGRSQQIVVTGPERDFPPTCTPAEFCQRLSGLTDALLTVDRAALES